MIPSAVRSICIGIPTYRRPADLDSVLCLLAPIIGPKSHVRVCVANDGSHDDAYAQVLARHRHTWLDYRILPQNGGCGAARRATFEGAGEDWLVCIDDDCVPNDRWFERLEALINGEPAVDLFAGEVRPVWREIPSAWNVDLAAADEASSLADGGFGLMTAVGANTAIRREAYEKAGGFLADTVGAEDCDITQRLIGSGAVYRICRDWEIGHIAVPSYRAMSRRFRSYGFMAARYVLIRRDWRIASQIDLPDRRQLGLRLRQVFLTTMKSAREEGFPGWRCYRRAAVMTLLTLHLQLAWRKGLRCESRKLGLDIPRPPSLQERFVDFI